MEKKTGQIRFSISSDNMKILLCTDNYIASEELIEAVNSSVVLEKPLLIRESQEQEKLN